MNHEISHPKYPPVMLNLDSNKPSSRFSRVRLTRLSFSGVSLPKVLLAISFAFLLFLGSTFAANINLNNNQSVEFGQGVVQTVACDDEVTITPYSSFVNESGGGSFKFTSIAVTGIREECDGKIFTIRAYQQSNEIPLTLYQGLDPENPGASLAYKVIEIEKTAGEFFLVNEETGLTNSDSLFQIPQESGDSGFEINFLNVSDESGPSAVPVALAEDVDRITIESRGGGQSSYLLGDIGPGGGIVIYDAGERQSWGRFIEMAPRGWWDDGDDNINLSWCYQSTAPTFDVNSSEESQQIGNALLNREAMRAYMNADWPNRCNPQPNSEGYMGIFEASWCYIGGEKNNWSVPTLKELEYVMTLPSEILALLQLDEGYYWSSNSLNGGSNQAHLVDILNQEPHTALKNALQDDFRLRPVRYF